MSNALLYRMPVGIAGAISRPQDLTVEPVTLASTNILIMKSYRLMQGQPGLDADTVTYRGREYCVTLVDPYHAYGAGVVHAHGELVNFDGGAPFE